MVRSHAVAMSARVIQFNAIRHGSDRVFVQEFVRRDRSTVPPKQTVPVTRATEPTPTRSRFLNLRPESDRETAANTEFMAVIVVSRRHDGIISTMMRIKPPLCQQKRPNIPLAHNPKVGGSNP